jgi:hypothetical protein
MGNTHAGQVKGPSQFFMHILQCTVQKFGRVEATVGTATLKVTSAAFTECPDPVLGSSLLTSTEAEAMEVKPLSRQFKGEVIQ